MPIVRDFRNFGFDAIRVDRCGKHVGRQIYWKLYAIENILRVIIHSVLSAQINPHWWNVAVDPKVRRRAQDFRQQYIRRPQHALPGRHEIYYVFLSDLNNILRANSNLFLPLVPDIDQWVARIEGVRLPRNIVGHMNFPNQYDRQQIDRLYEQFASLLLQLGNSRIPIEIP